MKKMQYNAPLTDVKTVAMISMLCASAGAGAGSGSGSGTTPPNSISFSLTTSDGLIAD